MRTCSISDCQRKYFAKELCEKHYDYKRHHGFSPEERQKTLTQMQDWRNANSQKMKAYKKAWYQENKKRINQKNTQRKKVDLQYRLSCNLRSRLRLALKNSQKKGSAVRDLGCSVEELKKYLEAQFQSKMTWENWGKGDDKWHIDHIKPLSAFNLENREHLLQAVHYSNLRPCWQEENLRKGGVR